MSANIDMNVLWSENKGLVYKIAQRYAGYAEFDDLIQEGFLALHKAAINHDESKGSFSTYATIVIKRHLYNYVQENHGVYMPAWIITLYMKYKKYVDDYIKQYGIKPSRQQAIIAIGAKDHLQEILQVESALKRKSIYDKPGGFNDEDLIIADIIPDNSNLENIVLDKVQQEELKDLLDKIISCLAPELQFIIRARYNENLTYKDILDKYHYLISQSVSLEKKAFRVLRKTSVKNLLRPYAEDILYNKSLRGSLISFNRTWTSSTEKAAIYDFNKWQAAKKE